MCGIVGVFDLKSNYMDLRPVVLKMSKKLRHRGPDWSGIFYCDNAILAHERLSIVAIWLKLRGFWWGGPALLPTLGVMLMLCITARYIIIRIFASVMKVLMSFLRIPTVK